MTIPPANTLCIASRFSILPKGPPPYPWYLAVAALHRRCTVAAAGLAVTTAITIPAVAASVLRLTEYVGAFSPFGFDPLGLEFYPMAEG